MAHSAWQWAPAQDRWVQLVEMLWANISKFPFLVFFKMAFCNTGHQDCEHGCKISVISLAGSGEGSLQLWGSSVVHSPTDCFFFSWCASSTTKSDTPPRLSLVLSQRCCSMTCAPASRFWLKTTSTTCQSSHSTSTISWSLLFLPTLRLLKCGTRKRWVSANAGPALLLSSPSIWIFHVTWQSIVKRWLTGFDVVKQRLLDYWCRLSSACSHRAKCSPPYSPRPASMMFAFTPTQVRITSPKAWDKINVMASVQGYTAVTAQKTEGSVWRNS